MKHFPKALKRAISDTAAYMTFDVRQSARAHGWSPDEAASLRVRHVDNKFQVFFEGKHSESALNREYGTEKHPPTGVARKFGNNPGKASEIFTQRLNKHLGGNNVRH